MNADRQPQAKPRRGRPPTEGLRDHLLDHTFSTLLREGFAGFSMGRVARSAKASKETLYRHFGDREGLLRAALERNSDLIEPLLSDGLGEAAGPDRPAERLDRLVHLAENFLRGATRPEAIALQRIAYSDGEQGLGPLFAEKVTAVVLEVFARELAAEGAPAPEADAGVFLGLIEGPLVRRVLFGVAPEDLEQAIEEQLASVRRVLRAYVETWGRG